MRLDSSGNLLVGTTTSAPQNFSSGSGTQISDGYIAAARGGAVALLNRVSTDGNIVEFKKDGTTVGSITTKDGDLSIGTGACGIRFNDGVSAVIPFNTTTNFQVDNTLDLGYPTLRFKDLYLSGGVVFGATGGNVTGATLDDYEEGTWTPTDYSGGSLSFTVNYAKYTKIGNLVHVQMYIVFPTTSDTSLSKIGNLPFSSEANGFAAGALNSDESTALVIQKNSNSNTFQIKGSGNTTITNATLSNNFIVSSFTYITAS